MTRYQIIKILDKEVQTTYLSEFEEKFPEIRPWLIGCIESLYYRPNKYLLILPYEVDFVPAELSIPEDIYRQMFLRIDNFEKKHLDFPARDEFIITTEADKRLCSYYTIEKEWRFPLRKTHIICEPQGSITHIPLLELWQEIYQTFKPQRKC